MLKSSRVAFVVAAAGVLLGGAGTLALWTGVSPQQWAVVIVALGLVGYAAAMFVAAFGVRRPRHVGG